MGTAGRWRRRCVACGAVFPEPCLRASLEGGKAVVASGVVGYRVTVDRRGKLRVFLGIGHRFANTSGWQDLYRWLVMELLDATIRSDYHVHHIDLDLGNNDPQNLEVLSVEFHGRLHASAAAVAMVRQADGRFAHVDHDVPICGWPRHGPIL